VLSSTYIQLHNLLLGLQQCSIALCIFLASSSLGMPEVAASSCATQKHIMFTISYYRGCVRDCCLLCCSTLSRLPAAAIYLVILLYMFVGVALASDKFMASIEVGSSGSSSSTLHCSNSYSHRQPWL
jgi:hypothetical protein